MKIFKILFLFLFLIFAINAQKAPSLKPAPDRIKGDGPFERLIIRGAILIDGTGSPPRGPVDIVIDKNIIIKVANVGTPFIEINDDKRPGNSTKEIDAKGMYVLPGLVDLHAHTGGPPKSPNSEYGYKLWLGHGVTTVRGVPFTGFDMSLS